MVEMHDFDPQRWWDGFYRRSEPEQDPGPAEQAIVAVLRDVAAGGPALELAVGGGRIAIPLAATGVDVDGIDFAPEAIELLRSHPEGGAVNASVADMSDFTMHRRYRLVYCVGNSLFSLTSQKDQVRCFECVARHLEPEGVFVVHSNYTQHWFETLHGGQYLQTRHLEMNSAWVQALRIDPTDQLLYQQNLALTPEGTRFSPSVHRYAALGELDLMARIAGLERTEVWGSWTHEPYNANSHILVATYRHPNPAARTS